MLAEDKIVIQAEGACLCRALFQNVSWMLVTGESVCELLESAGRLKAELRSLVKGGVIGSLPECLNQLSAFAKGRSPCACTVWHAEIERNCRTDARHRLDALATGTTPADDVDDRLSPGETDFSECTTQAFCLS